MSGPAATGVRRLAGTVTIIETGTVTELMPTVPNATKASTGSMVAAKVVKPDKPQQAALSERLVFLNQILAFQSWRQSCEATILNSGPRVC